MFDQLQDVLNEYEQMKESVEALQLKLLEKSCELDQAHTKIEQLQKDAMISDKVEQTASKALALSNINQKLIYSVEQHQMKIKSLENELRDMKGNNNPKKLKDQVNRLKDKNKELTKGNDLLKLNNKQYRSDVNKLRKDLKNQLISRMHLAMTHAFTKDGHELWLVPTKLGIDRGHGNERIMCLLHLAPNGIGYLVTVMNGEIHLDKEVANLPKMPQEMYDHAEAWLAKVEAQNYAVTDADLMALGGFSDLDGDI